MKIAKTDTKPSLKIPTAVMKMTDLSGDEHAELHTCSNAVVVLKEHLTAKELIDTVVSLQELATGLTVHLAKLCGPCRNCDDCPSDGFDDESERITLPDYLMDAIGLPHDAKLEALVNEEAGTVTIGESEYEHDLTDVPEGFLDVLIASGVCIFALEKHLMLEDTVYGEE